jgi:hypothetical protein
MVAELMRITTNNSVLSEFIEYSISLFLISISYLKLVKPNLKNATITGESED